MRCYEALDPDCRHDKGLALLVLRETEARLPPRTCVVRYGVRRCWQWHDAVNSYYQPNSDEFEIECL